MAAAAERFNVGVSTVFLWCKTPEKVKAEKPGPKVCSKLGLDRLRAMLAARPTAYQAELAYLLGVSQPTVWLGRKRLKLTRKKTTTYREKDDSCRSLFVEHLKAIPAETIVYVDESALDEAIQREYGYALKGQRLPGEVSGKRFVERHSIIAGLLAGAPWGFNGYCDTEVVLTWVKHVLVPELKPGLTVVI